MFSAGQVSTETVDLVTSLETDLSPLTSTAGGMSTENSWSMGLQSGAALVNAIGQWASLGIQNRSQNNHFDRMTELADRKMEMQIGALNAKEEQMKVVAAVRKKRQGDVRERVEAEGELRVSKKVLEEEKATRELSKIDVRGLERHFSRNDYFYGRGN